MQSISIENILEHFKLEILAGQEGVKRKLSVIDIKRPGIELAGYWEHFTPERLQLFGRTETNFLNNLSASVRRERLEKFYSYPLKGVIITRNLNPPDPMIEFAERAGVPLLRASIATTQFLSKMTGYLERMLAPSQTVHGVLVEVYGIGVLLTGTSGIGKSETALELVKRCHRLVADDLVMIKKIGANTLVGCALPLNQHHMELRGIGIIDVKTLFGAGAVKIEQKIHLTVKLQDWNCGPGDDYDRLGLDTNTTSLLGLDIPQVIIPVRPGRNLPTIIEVAALNHRLQFMGYNAARQFVQRLEEEIKRKQKGLLDWM